MRAIGVGEPAATGQLRASSLACAIASVLLLCPCPAAIAQDQEDARNAGNAVEEQEAAARKQHRAALAELERQKQVLMQQHVEAERQRQRAEEEFARQREEQAHHAARLQAELQRAQAQIEEFRARHEATQAAPLPENSQLRVFNLQHVNPHSVTEILANILRNNAPRIAVDDRSNSLLVAGNDKQLSIVEELARTLDKPANESETQKPGETLQVRVVWLLDIDEGMKPNDKLVSPQVIEALAELGFEHPKVVCQQVTTLTLSEEYEGRRRGRFNFSVPVLIQSQPWYFEGTGQIEPLVDDRFNLQFEMQFQKYTGEGGRRSINQGKLGGSIYTPLGHYTVMGTTTFVATKHHAERGQITPEAMLEQVRREMERGRQAVPDDLPSQQEQHLSAFVVHLDRAKEFPAANTFRQSEPDE